MKMKSSPSPRHDSRITGRLPWRSDRAPWIGAVTNWITANTVPKRPTQYAADAVSPPVKPSIRCGSTGMIKPNASTSISTVTKMKASAAVRLACPGRVEGRGAVDSITGRYEMC